MSANSTVENERVWPRVKMLCIFLSGRVHSWCSESRRPRRQPSRSSATPDRRALPSTAHSRRTDRIDITSRPEVIGRSSILSSAGSRHDSGPWTICGRRSVSVCGGCASVVANTLGGGGGAGVAPIQARPQAEAGLPDNAAETERAQRAMVEAAGVEP